MISLGPRKSAGKRSRRFTRSPSPVLAYLTPWMTIAIASYIASLPTVTSAPLMPPLGFLVLLSWRQLHPGLLPIWAGLPLGFVDDLVSGQPMGSGILTWSVAMIALDMIEFRWPWRNFSIEWAVAAGLIATYIIVAALIAQLAGGGFALPLILPQLGLSALLYPVVARVVARADSFRLTRFWAFG